MSNTPSIGKQPSTADLDSLERSLKRLPTEHLRLIEAALARSGDVAKPEQDISGEFDEFIDEINDEIDAGDFDDLAEAEEHLARSVGRLTHELDREASWMKAVNDIYDEPSELELDDDDDDSLEDDDE
jgi:hypothetical protein